MYFIGTTEVTVKTFESSRENRSDTNLDVEAQKMARGLKFWIQKVEELYYPCSENKGADKLLHLCFRICKLLVFS